MSFIFGGSKSENKSYNTNKNLLTNAYAPVMGATGEGYNAIKSLLGGNTQGFDTYKKAAGYDFAAKEGAAGVLANGAARGLLRSGATGKGLISYGQKMADQYLDSYMQKLLGMSQLGLGAGQLIAEGGKESTSKSSSKPGIGKFIGQVAAGLAMSDPRLKENVVPVGELEDGLGLYSWNYIWDDKTRHVGVMADEVAEKRPWALGPEINGYMTVDYDRLGDAV